MIVDPAIDAVQINLKINGETPFYESQTLVLPSEWQFEQISLQKIDIIMIFNLGLTDLKFGNL